MYLNFAIRGATLPLLLCLSNAGESAAQSAARDTLSLDGVIARALSSHPRVGIAEQGARAARGNRLSARSWSNPTFNYQSEGSSPGHGLSVEREVMTFGTLPIEPLYQIWPRSAQASAQVRAADADLAAVRRAVAIDAAQRFFATLSAQVSVTSLQDVRAWLDSLVTYTNARVHEGVAAEVDLIRLQVEQGRTETSLAMARVDLTRARAQLATMIGMDQFILISPTQLPATQLSSRDTAIDLALRARPELQAADARVDAARSGVSLERSRIVRELGVMGGVKTMDGRRSLMTGLSVPIPLFDQNRGEIQRADAERHMAALEREQVTRQVKADVVATYAAVETLTQQLSLMRDSLLRRAEEARHIAEAAYREGATSLVQVLDASRALAEAREVYYNALFARQQSLLELNPSLGVQDNRRPQ